MPLPYIMRVDVGTHGWMWTREWRGCLLLLYRESASAPDKGLAESDTTNHLLGYSVPGS